MSLLHWSCSSILLSLLFVTHVSAWWGHGHCLVLQVAENELKKAHPNVLTVAENILQEYVEFFPRDSSFVGSATWSDNLNAEGFLLFKTWHYYDEPYILDQNVSAPANGTDAPNMIWALDECSKGLASKYKPASPWAASFYLRWINHLMGDLHQPLHNVAQFNADLHDAQGDRGGNSCLLDHIASNISESTKNLHSFFDSAGGQFMFDPFYPPGGPGLTDKYKVMFAEQAAQLTAEFPRESYATAYIENINFTAWSKEGYDLAVRMAYNGNGPAPGLIRCALKKNITLTPEYIAEVQRVTRERIAIAGYRLANLLAVKIPFAQWMPPVNRSSAHDIDKTDFYNELRNVILDLYNGTLPNGMPANVYNMTAAPTGVTYSSFEAFLLCALGITIGVIVTILAVWFKRRHSANAANQFRPMTSSA
jgi:hypothetical protein